MGISLVEMFSDLFKLRRDGTKFKVSQAFWDWLKYSEGNPKKKGEPILKTYKDSRGVPTIGYGHTGPDVKWGMAITKDNALKLLYSDATKAANCVRRLLNEWKLKNVKGYQLTQNEFDALVSIVFNSGCSATRSSTFIQDLKNGDYTNASLNIKKHKNAGLANRRNAEYEMFRNCKYIKN